MSIFYQCLSSVRKPCVVALGILSAGVVSASLTIGTAHANSGFQSVFECGEVIGKVFEDKNRNGVQDHGEAGLPGVRLASAQGLLTITDKHGRYHVSCAEASRRSIGSLFVLKVDPRSLPIGHRITTENPRSVRLTAGKVSKMNFGTAESRMVRLDLEGAAFKPNSTELNPKWDAGIDQLVSVLGEDHSVLRLVYQKGAEDKALATKRMKAVAQLVKQRWHKQDSGYHLEIDRRMKLGR